MEIKWPGIVAGSGGYGSIRAGQTGIWKPLTAEIGNETFIDRKLELILLDPRKKLGVNFLLKQKNHGQYGGSVLHGDPQPGNNHPYHKKDPRPETKSGYGTEDGILIKSDIRNEGLDLGAVPGSCGRTETCINVKKPLTAEIGDETFIDRRMEFLSLMKILFDSSQTKTKPYLSGGGIPYNAESADKTGLNRNVSQPVNTDGQKGYQIEERTSLEYNVRGRGPGSYTDKGKYTTYRSAEQNISKPLPAQTGDETFIDRMMVFAPTIPPHKIRKMDVAETQTQLYVATH